MNVTIEQSAIMTVTANHKGLRYSDGIERPAVIAVDGERWTSPIPKNAGEAQTFNRQAQELCWMLSN